MKRPASISWLALAVFCLAGINGGRAGILLADWQLWIGFDLPFWLPLRVAFSIVWALTLGLTAWGLWSMRRIARRWTLIIFPVYQIYQLIWRLLFVQSAYQRGRIPFVLTTVAGSTLLVVWLLTRPRIKKRFDMNGTPATESVNDQQFTG